MANDSTGWDMMGVKFRKMKHNSLRNVAFGPTLELSNVDFCSPSHWQLASFGLKLSKPSIHRVISRSQLVCVTSTNSAPCFKYRLLPLSGEHEGHHTANAIAKTRASFRRDSVSNVSCRRHSTRIAGCVVGVGIPGRSYLGPT